MAFYFEKPAGFSFVAGQFCEITLINPPETDGEGNSRQFSIASAPHEPRIMIATRMRDTAFKRVLKNLPLGSAVIFEGPYGDFVLHENVTRPAVFLIGGIGITPVRSMLIVAAQEHKPHKLFLFYSNRRPEDAPFLSELQELQSKNSNYTFIGTMTEMDKSQQTWTGKTGYVNAEMVKKYISEPNAVYYLVGPAAMVGAMRRVTRDLGIDPDMVRSEDFTGY